MKQQELNLYCGRHGGVRSGSGRPRKHSKGVSHSRRESVTRNTPLHINFKYSAFIQTDAVLKSLQMGFYNALNFDFEVCYYTIQSNHIHIIAEAKNRNALIQGMRSLTNTLVKRIGKGSIQVERYHLHVLKKPTETKNALDYVINNDLKHTGKKHQKFTGNYSPAESWLLQKAEKELLLH